MPRGKQAEEPDDEEPDTDDEQDDDPPSDRMEKPEFYRGDLQAFYDAQIVTGEDPHKALAKTKRHFKLRSIEVTPTGELRAPGIVDDPDGPEAPPAQPQGGDEEEPDTRDEIEGDEPGSSLGDEDPAGKDPAKPDESLDEAGRRPPGFARNKPDDYRMRCGKCRHFKPEESNHECVKYDWPVNADDGCEAWAPKRGEDDPRKDEAELDEFFNTLDTNLYPTKGEVVRYFLRHRKRPQKLDAIMAGIEHVFPTVKDLKRVLKFLVRRGDIEPAGKLQWVMEAGPQAPDRCSIPDAVWLEFLREGGDLDEFEAEAGVDPDLWEAPDLSLSIDEARKLRERLPEDRIEKAAKFARLVNMRPAEIRAHLRSEDLREAIRTSRRNKRKALIEGKRRSRQVLRLKALPVEEWTDDDWRHCSEILTHVERTRRNAAPLVEGGTPTRKTHALRCYGHNPLREGVVSYADFEALYEDDDRQFADRIIAACATDPDRPVRVAEDALDEAPQWDTLKKGKVKLTDEERKCCLDREAVWNYGNQGSPSPAVWKSQVGGETWFVTNTHRAYNVARTLDGAIGRYHKFIKHTA